MEARHLYYEASAMIIGLINLGHMLEARARQRSSKALEKLLDLTPPTARVVTEDGEKSVPLADVQPGMLLRLTTGDRVPVDGEITQGEAWLDEAMLTGEPIPQQKGEGDSVHAGTVVQDGSVLFRASAVGSHTTLSRIIRMVRQAQSSKPEIGQLADKNLRGIRSRRRGHCAVQRRYLVFLRTGAANCLYAGHRHHRTDYRLPLRIRPGDANVDYFRRRPRCRIRRAGTRRRCPATRQYVGYPRF